MTLAEGIAALRALASKIDDAADRLRPPESTGLRIEAGHYYRAADYLASLASKPKRKKRRKQ